MIICEKCFCDMEIVSAIRNKGIIGDCTLCASKSVYIYDTDKDEDVGIMFDELISIYSPISLLSCDYPRKDTDLLQRELINNWRIFNSNDEADIFRIITSICREKYQYEKELFEQPVGIAQLYDQDYLQKHSLLTTNSWIEFVDALKTKNRYHTHYIDLDLLERFCSYIRKPYKKGKVFYRCRISDKEGFTTDEMGAPPIELTTDGRANARGIRCLYLGDTKETTIYETRAGVFDYVTVGEFVLKEDIIVVDLKRINQISPFTEGLDCLEYAINREHLNKINDEMSKAMRRSDSTLDYVPTQYITDFIKNIMHKGKQEYAGIEYKSVMHNDGFNLALFDPEIAECVNTEVYRIDTIEYRKHEI